MNVDFKDIKVKLKMQTEMVKKLKSVFDHCDKAEIKPEIDPERYAIGKAYANNFYTSCAVIEEICSFYAQETKSATVPAVVPLPKAAIPVVVAPAAPVPATEPAEKKKRTRKKAEGAEQPDLFNGEGVTTVELAAPIVEPVPVEDDDLSFLD